MYADTHRLGRISQNAGLYRRIGLHVIMYPCPLIDSIMRLTTCLEDNRKNYWNCH